MGGRVSKNKTITQPTNMAIPDTLLKEYLSQFIESHCEIDSNGYIPYDIIIAMFYTYLSNQQCIIPMRRLENSMYQLILNVIKDNFGSSIVRSEGISFVRSEPCNYTRTNYNYGYIYGLKLTKPVHSIMANE